MIEEIKPWMREAYEQGGWVMKVPPVCHARWRSDDWIRWIGEHELKRVYKP
jgi:hypothetical protein